MEQPEPGVRRLCVAVAAGTPGLLLAVRRSGRLDRLYVSTDPHSRVEVGVAPPGVDELGLLRDLVLYLRRELDKVRPAPPGRVPSRRVPPAGRTLSPPVRTLSRPVLLVLHVGIVRAVDGGLGGAGADRSRALAGDREIQTVADRDARDRGNGAGLAVVVSDGLFADLRAEGLPAMGWKPVSTAAAWIRSFNNPPVPRTKSGA